jgi:hypothetical protein
MAEPRRLTAGGWTLEAGGWNLLLAIDAAATETVLGVAAESQVDGQGDDHQR